MTSRDASMRAGLGSDGIRARSEPGFTPRAAYRGLHSYDVDHTPVAHDLSDNTSPWGVPPSALAAAREACTEALSRYPSAYSRNLREAMARYVGVSADEVLAGAGSDELLSCAFRALGEPGARVAYMHPTFVMTPVFATTNSLVPVPVPLAPNLSADPQALLGVGAPLTYLCSPNNPTGILEEADAVGRIVNDARGVVLIDEAYAEYAGTNWAAQAPRHANVLAFRTLSKAFGLASFRVGFAVGSRTLIREMEKARGPFTISRVSEEAATAALALDVAWVRRGVDLVVRCRERFATDLRNGGFAVPVSSANFVLVPVRDAAGAAAAALEHGIRVRPFVGLAGIGDALRITIGTSEVMERVRDVLMEIGPRGRAGS